MKGVILGGGYGRRLRPLTDPLNKHLLPVFDRPMIVHVVDTLVKSGIDEILIVLNGLHPGLFLEMLEDGRELGCHLSYRYARNINGPGRTLLMAERWIGKEPFALILGDSYFTATLPLTSVPAPHAFVMPLNGHDDYRKYGQVRIKDGVITEILWKPEDLFSNIIQTTCFVLPPDAFERLHALDRSTKGEVCVTALTSQYVEEGSMTCTMLPSGSYLDCGTYMALLRAGILRSKKI